MSDAATKRRRARPRQRRCRAHVRDEIDHWVAKFPEGRQRSAVIAALRRRSTRIRVI